MSSTDDEEPVITRELKAYPNPTSGKLNVVFSAKGNERVTFLLMDILGNLIHNESYLSNEGDNLKEFDFSRLNKGIYFLIVVDGVTETRILKIVIQ